MDQKQLQEKILTIQKLPSCPRIIPEIIRLVREPCAGMAEYEKVISRDPALTAQVLRIVNSSYYNVSKKVSDLRLALTLLGTQEIYRIVLNASFYQILHSVFDRLAYDFNIFWKHSQVAANAASYLAEKFENRFMGEAYAAALLHDVGKLIMEQYFPQEWEKVVVDFETSGKSFCESEKKYFGLTHAEIGVLLLETWQIPPEIVTAVQYHHHPIHAPKYEEIVGLVYFADKMATSCTHFFIGKFPQGALPRDQFFEPMIQKFPHFQFLRNEKVLAHLKSLITKEMPVGI